MAGEYEEMVSDDKMNPRTALCVHWLFYPPSLHFIPKIWALCWLACPRTTSGKLWACQDQRIECWVSEREHDFLSDIWVLCCFFFTDFIDKMKWSCLTWISGSSLQTETADLSSVGYIRSMAGMDTIRTLLLSDLLKALHTPFLFLFLIKIRTLSSSDTPKEEHITSLNCVMAFATAAALGRYSGGMH